MSHPFSILDGHNYMSLTTFRKSGEGVPTADWFAREGDVLYMTTMREAGKAKRIRHTPRVTMTPCKGNGELLGSEKVEGVIRVLDANESQAAKDALKHKYGFQLQMFNLMGWVTRSLNNRIYLEIKPTS